MVNQLPPEFDPFNQTFTLIDGTGMPFNVTIDDVNYLNQYGIRLAINYASQIGASAMLLLILLLLTKREKRRSWIFFMNGACLSINIVRSVLQCLWLTGSFWNIYSQLAYDISRDGWQDKANTIAANTMNLLLVICIMASLSMQVWVVSITAPMIQRILIIGTTSILALIAIGYRFAVTVISNISTMQSGDINSKRGIVTVMYIFQAIAIWSYCAIFTFKLGYAILQRRRIGMTQFGPMQIIFIMGAQTMVIPAIFSVLQFYDHVPEFASQTLTFVCIFLPLSAIWAGVISSDGDIATKGPDAHHRLLQGQFGRTSTRSASGSGSSHNKNSTSGSTFKDPESPTYYDTKSSAGVIHVDRQWSVEKSEASSASAYDRV